MKKDLAIVVDKAVTAQEIEMQIKKSTTSTLKEITVFDLYTGKGIEEGKKSLRDEPGEPGKPGMQKKRHKRQEGDVSVVCTGGSHASWEHHREHQGGAYLLQ